MDLNRWNDGGTGNAENTVHVSLCGADIRIAQNAESHNCGTTAWDASFVLAKYIERNLSSLKEKVVIELGAGVSGLPGMACALLGAAHVLLTDIDGPVLALLKKNVERNVSTAQIAMNGSALNCALRRAPDIAELRWGVQEDITGCIDSVPSIDYILAADCVYNENAVRILLDTIIQLLEQRGKRTTKVLICNEYRSETVHQAFLTQFAAAGFTPLKKEKEGSMHPEYKHELIHVYKMKRKLVGS